MLMSTLAQREDVSRKYLHALLTALKSAGLVRSVRGAGGGFVLGKAPADTRLGEILRAVEGPLSLVDCVADARACEKSSRCVARRVWQGLSRSIESMLDSMTLEDLVARPGRAALERHKSGGNRAARREKANSKRCGRNKGRGPRGKKCPSRRAGMLRRGKLQKVGKK